MKKLMFIAFVIAIVVPFSAPRFSHSKPSDKTGRHFVETVVSDSYRSGHLKPNDKTGRHFRA